MGDENAQNKLYNLIVSMIAVKMLNIIFMQFISRWLLFHYKKVMYFRKCKALGEEQRKKHK